MVAGLLLVALGRNDDVMGACVGSGEGTADGIMDGHIDGTIEGLPVKDMISKTWTRGVRRGQERKVNAAIR